MSRRNPILLTVLIITTIVGLFVFSRSFESSPSLRDVQRVSDHTRLDPASDPKSPKFDTHKEEKAHYEKDVYEPPSVEDPVRHLVHSGVSTAHAAPTHLTPTPNENGANKKEANEKEVNENENGANEEQVRDAPANSAYNVDDLIEGQPIMAKMPNQTVRAEVGRAGWKLLHTILSQYPETPTSEQKATLETYIKLFSRIYPCQECAYHFQELLKNYPPQLSSRKNAVMWGCNAHNVVNKRLGKPEYDCTYIFDEYDCGCGDASASASGSGSKSRIGASSVSLATHAATRTAALAQPTDLDKIERTHSVPLGNGI